jgi:hypothetical protein
MKSIHSMIAVAALAFTVPAQAGTADPEVVLYRASGVFDSGGGAFSGNATTFVCTPFSGVTENVRFVVRAVDGTLVANVLVPVPHLNTGTVFTKQIGLFSNGTNMNTGSVQQGTVAIAATSTSVTCTGMLVQANITTPAGIQLHMTRFNPLSGTQE